MNIRNRIPHHLRPGVRVSDSERCACEVAAVTGSHNFFKSASTKNDENFIVITGDPTLAEAYTVNVIAAHGFVLGAEVGGGERAAHLVEEYALTAQSFPPTIGYGALGHIHRPQRIPAGPALHYCGSPLQLDFGEGEQVKQVNVVTLEPGVPAAVAGVRLTSGRPLRTVRGTLDELQASARTTATPSLDVLNDEPWLRVIVRGPTRAGLAELVRQLLGTRVVEVRIEANQHPTRDRATDHRNRSPQELFDEYLAVEDVVDDRVRALFAELLDQEVSPA
jgi:exonuclease SbcD